jgi:hypothetical protein
MMNQMSVPEDSYFAVRGVPVVVMSLAIDKKNIARIREFLLMTSIDKISKSSFLRRKYLSFGKNGRLRLRFVQR